MHERWLDCLDLWHVVLVGRDLHGSCLRASQGPRCTRHVKANTHDPCWQVSLLSVACNVLPGPPQPWRPLAWYRRRSRAGAWCSWRRRSGAMPHSGRSVGHQARISWKTHGLLRCWRPLGRWPRIGRTCSMRRVPLRDRVGKSALHPAASEAGRLSRDGPPPPSPVGVGACAVGLRIACLVLGRMYAPPHGLDGLLPRRFPARDGGVCRSGAPGG